MHKTTGLTHLIKSTGYSIKGLKAAIKYETAFRHELSLSLILLPCSYFLVTDFRDALLLIGSIALVLIAELLNSAVEAIVDRVGTEFHELSGRAKDLGSAAVFVALVFAGIVWGSFAFNFLLH